MTRTSRMFWILAVALLAASTVPVKAQSSMEISDLRQRISAVEQQLFQQRMNTGPSTPAVDQLSARVTQLERDLASQRITDTTNDVLASGQRRSAAADTVAALTARIKELEEQRLADSRRIEALVKRVEALEKPVFKPRLIKK